MASKAEARRKALRDTLIDIAQRVIEADGLGAIKARALAQEAGCSVGAIYNVFDDLDDIVIAVNGRTFDGLGRFVAGELAARAPQDPPDHMVTMSYAYLDYAADHPQLWRALFDLRLTNTSTVPQWYRDALDGLFAMIDEPVRAHFPNMTEDQVQRMTRVLFSSVHGIVLLGLENRLSDVPRGEIRKTIDMLIRSVTGNTAF